ncbi:MAG: hypothetical protein MRERV_11c071 [Mycoplasmataceae bacterium RV_VA103A]|nr:MAG: hypothetical protein MRERV_11c071 [Mycoplasmataceae bacterium RV_VA103A]
MKPNKNNQTKDFKKYLQEIEKPDYDGPDTSRALPINATPLEKAKYKLCEKILAYQQDNNLSITEVAERIKLTTAETKDIFHYHLDCFTFDRLITYANRLFSPREIEVVINEKKVSTHADTV